MLKRKIDSFLSAWKKREHFPLIVYGARQVGKTTSIREFASKEYENLVEINFLLNPEYKEAFKTYDVDNIIQRLSYINPKFKFIANKTLIFFDEIQSFMDTTTSLKSFALDKRFDVICSGSALGVNNNHISSVAVGFKEEYVMKPLDFEEYLWALGYQSSFFDDVRAQLFTLKLLDSLLLNILNDHYDEYIVLGGMPKIVNSFIETKTYSQPYRLQKLLRKDYLDDIKQYLIELDKAKVEKIYESIPYQLAKDNHKFMFSKLGHGARFSSYFGCIEWLKDAGIILVVDGVNSLNQPLKLQANDNNFRLYFADTGLFMAFLDKDEERKLRINNDFNIYKGGLYENIVLEDLDKSGFENIYFYRSEDSTVELDFLLEIQNHIVPIEVKARNGRTISLRRALEKQKLPLGIKLTKQSIGYYDGILSLPYAVTFLLKEVIEQDAFKRLLVK